MGPHFDHGNLEEKSQIGNSSLHPLNDSHFHDTAMHSMGVPCIGYILGGLMPKVHDQWMHLRG